MIEIDCIILKAQQNQRREVLIDVMIVHLLVQLIRIYKETRSQLLRSLIEVVFIRCLRNGMPKFYFVTHLQPHIWNMLFSSDIQQAFVCN